MNFDRKSGNSNGKVTEGSSTFPELPRMFGGKAQSGFSGRNLPADRQNFAGGAYPSGAFPALDIAYPDQAAAEAGGNFVPDNSVNRPQPAFSPYEAPAAARAAGPAAPYTVAPPSGARYHHTVPAGGGEAAAFSPGAHYEAYARDPALYAAAGEASPYDPRLQEPQAQDFAAEESYDHRSFTPENEPGGYEEAYAAMPGVYAPDSRPEEAGMSAGSFAGDSGRSGAAGNAAESFYAEESFHRGLNGDSALQPVEFAPSDYDYNYDPQAEESFEPEFSAGAGRQPYPADSLPADHLYEPGAYPEPEAAGIPQDYDTAAFAEAEMDNAARQAPARQDFARGYNMQAAAYNSNGGAFYTHDSGQHNNSRAFAAAANLYGDPAAAARPAEEAGGGYAEAGFDYAEAAAGDQPYNAAAEAPLPFIEDEEENTDLAADFARLKTDAGMIDAAAGRAPSDLPGGNFSRPPAPPRGEMAADTEFFAAPARQAAAGSVEQAGPYAGERDFAAEAAYGDSLYDWAAPVAAPAAPHKQVYPAVKKAKGKKMLPAVAVSLFLLLLAAGLYWFLGNRPVSYNSEPVIIHKAAGDYKVRPDNPVTKAVDNQEQSVREGVSDNNAGQNRQENLIDQTETPVEMQKMEDRLPFSDEGSFDQSSVDSLIKSAVARAAPVHIIPAVRVTGDRKLVTSSARRGEEEILIPGSGAAAAKQEARPEKTGSKVSLAPPAAAAPPVKTARQTAAPIAKSPAAKTELAQTAAIGGSFYMQISSQPSKEAAEQSVARARKYLSEDAGRRIVIVPALIPNKGTYYRVRIPAESHEAAARLCEDYKQSGGSCFVAR